MKEREGANHHTDQPERAQPQSHAGYYETSHHQQLMTDIKSAILEGHLIALCGVIGRGKTVTLRRETDGNQSVVQ